MLTRLMMGTGLVLILSACVSKEVKSSGPTAKWVSNMHRLSAAYVDLLPYAADPRSFSDSRNHEAIQTGLMEMQIASSAVAHDPQPPNADPILGYTATRFAIEMRQAASSFAMGDTQWARYSIARASDYCVNCHTSVNIGAKDFPVTWQTQLGSLPPAQKIESLIAMRQYASALTLAHAFVWNKQAAASQTRYYLTALERVMAMLIRVNKDVDEAIQLASSVMSNASAPFFVRNDAAAWFDDLKEWKNEKPPQAERAKFNLAKSLVDRAAIRPHMPANLVVSLRASGLLHEILQTPKGAKRADVLYQAGLVSQSLRDINLGYLDQYYFEACIRAEPHTDIAEQCFVQLDTAVHDSNLFNGLDAGGSSATESKLAELRQLAEPRETEGQPGWKSRLWDYNLDENGKPERKRGH